ncbi:mycofactocin oligosaccharide methyltransferase MftM [Pseudonocardia sp. CA-107938]|uniref:mycofactocin oligosaccharide methyltransferase MftM n=1 Tax=Pseudonocardia sp. CA-107938 TaxID=3240021 RepID=UPI003D8EFD69
MTTGPAVAPHRPIDPLATVTDGRYEDDLVVVTRGSGTRHGVRTRDFGVWTEGDKLHVVHRLPPAAIDDDLTGRLAAQLFTPGWLSGSDTFERLFTGIVLTSADTPDAAWDLFYRNTMRRLTTPLPGQPGSLAQYAPVYRHAVALAEGSVLELGCCFGFLSLLLAERHRVTATDVNTNTVRLLARVAARHGVRLDTEACDAARVPRPDRSVDTVLAIHLLEHLEPDHGRAVVAEALRLARRRVVIAVPFEDEPTAVFGHVRTFDLDSLAALGRWTGEPFTVHEHHGGWLVIDRSARSARSAR